MIEVTPFISLIIVALVIKAHELNASKQIESLFSIESIELNKATIALNSLANLHSRISKEEGREEKKEVIKLLSEYIKQLK